MNLTTENANGQSGPDRWCAECEGALDGDAGADVHDGELVCGACGLARRRGDAQEELDELTNSRAELEGEMDDRREQYRADEMELDREFGVDMADLRRRLAACDRRIAGSARRLAAIDAAAEPAGVEVAPIAGGAPYEPTPEDLAEMGAIWAAEEARDAARRAEDERNPLYGYE